MKENRENIGLTFLLRRDQVFERIAEALEREAGSINHPMFLFQEETKLIAGLRANGRNTEEEALVKLISLSGDFIQEAEGAIRRLKQVRDNAEAFLHIDEIRADELAEKEKLVQNRPQL